MRGRFSAAIAYGTQREWCLSVDDDCGARASTGTPQWGRLVFAIDVQYTAAREYLVYLREGVSGKATNSRQSQQSSAAMPRNELSVSAHGRCCLRAGLVSMSDNRASCDVQFSPSLPPVAVVSIA